MAMVKPVLFIASCAFFYLFVGVLNSCHMFGTFFSSLKTIIDTKKWMCVRVSVLVVRHMRHLRGANDQMHAQIECQTKTWQIQFYKQSMLCEWNRMSCASCGYRYWYLHHGIEPNPIHPIRIHTRKRLHSVGRADTVSSPHCETMNPFWWRAI